VPDLVQLEQKLFAHDLQRADLSRVFLLGKKHLTVTALTDLCKNLEISLSKADTPLAQIGTLPSRVLMPHLTVGLLIRSRRRRVFRLESIESILPGSDVGQEIEVVVEEI
jgi:hypothetical protein